MTDSSMINFCDAVVPEVITKPKTMGFLKTAVAAGIVYFLICLCLLDVGGKTINTPPTHPSKYIIISNQLHC